MELRGALLPRLRQSWAQVGVTNPAVKPEPQLLWAVGFHTNAELQQCRGAAASPPRSAQKQEGISPPEHFSKAWSGSCCPGDTFCMCVLGARSEKHLPSKGRGWKKTVNISRWQQAKIYPSLARLSCRKAFRLDLKLF